MTLAKRPTLLVVGGGIAGASVAYYAAQAGYAVTLLDAAAGPSSRASDVTAALLNPVRGQSGQVDARALAGLRCTWALVAALAARGYAVAHGRSGVLRPIPDEKTRRKWQSRLPPELPHTWLNVSEVSRLPSSWHSVLRVPEGGWVSGPQLVRALKAASGARVVQSWVAQVTARGAHLAGGGVLSADKVVCAGGSAGAAGVGVHRAGHLLLLSAAASPVPLSFGVYLSPTARGGVLGATFEAPACSYAQAVRAGLPLKSLAWLLSKGVAMHEGRLSVTGRWSGVRLSGLEHTTQPDTSGLYHLTGLGSKGFLLGPLLAQELVASWERAT